MDNVSWSNELVATPICLGIIGGHGNKSIRHELKKPWLVRIGGSNSILFTNFV